MQRQLQRHRQRQTESQSHLPHFGKCVGQVVLRRLVGQIKLQLTKEQSQNRRKQIAEHSATRLHLAELAFVATERILSLVSLPPTAATRILNYGLGA